jgi:hypothetical protein
VGVKDVILPATRSLLNTARLMDENPTLLRLKELETLEKVTEKVDKLTVFGGLDGVLKDTGARPHKVGLSSCRLSGVGEPYAPPDLPHNGRDFRRSQWRSPSICRSVAPGSGGVRVRRARC